ncbi:peptidase S41 [Ammoniphilus oxalaticus]|uniref:Peptidase S41 n=1 Tax=Ammoniphilus oxalaticus TaxID=66863 RepID=A0A419SEY3_9BACL|nr:S41 family peptidase [Ammoniphilus oxalaticus]RKD21886.1 peptidase S41 [Ammoniphilus oxalaticus]
MKRLTLAALLGVTVALSSLFTAAALGSGDGGIGQTVDQFLGKIGLRNSDTDIPKAGRTASGADLQKINEVYRLIKENYLEDVADEKLIDGAINGMLNALEDPYSVYMDPTSTKEFNDSIHSSFEGIGAEVTLDNGKVTIVSPFKGSPAEKAGLRPKDQILKVDGNSLEGLDLYQAVLKIRGPKGSSAKMEVLRPGVKDPLVVEVVRDEIPIETVYSETIERDGMKLGKLEITQFATETADHFKQELEKLEAQKIDGLLVDLRGNPGGLLPAVVDMAQLLVPDEGVILQVEDPNGNRELIKSSSTKKKPYPITVLIDKGSASASEILAGALQENGYTLVGQHSFGKGTVQNTVPLGDDSQLKMTIAKWLTPSGKWINNDGIEPNVKVEQPAYFEAAPIHLEENKTLQFDQNGEEVRNLQVIMSGLGFPTGRSDGYFDEKTATAVKAFQKLNSLPTSGQVDGQTAKAMQEALLNKMKEPENDLQLQAAIQTITKQVKK